MQCVIKTEPAVDFHFQDVGDPTPSSSQYMKRRCSMDIGPTSRVPNVTDSSTDAMNRLLQNWGLEALIHRFAEHLIDLSVLDYMLDVDIVDLCQGLPIRYRLLLRHNLRNGYHKDSLAPDQPNKRQHTTVETNENSLYEIHSNFVDNCMPPPNFVSVPGSSPANDNNFTGAEYKTGYTFTPRSADVTNEEELRMSDSDSESQMDAEAPEEVATDRLIPEKSKALYEGSYKKFDEWRSRNNYTTVDENAMLAYFSQEMGNQKPSTNWSHFSMLKATINMNLGINISGFTNLVSYLKQNCDGYSPKKSKILTKGEIFRFLKEADDEKYLALKVVLIVGVYGACRREEILKLTLNDIEDTGNSVKITVPNSKSKTLRQFVITRGSDPEVDMVKLFRLYAQKRPVGVPHSRFFIGYRYGKCTKQAIGINSIAHMPKQIAEFLHLPSPQEYTGHCFRRSAVSLQGDSGVDIAILKRQGGSTSKMHAITFNLDTDV
ncbi:uncharacterized protein LOC115257648 [Aedes albopictus]|uniref:Tyr recombinase domain-containing protein n=1 Tax=Aedes albopictus TaxID=7160 RepID=A0ABM1Y6V2_AEDAL